MLQTAYAIHKSKTETSSLESLLAELEKANNQKNYLNQCQIIAKMSELYLAREQYFEAAKLINGSLSICKKHIKEISTNQDLRRALLRQQNNIETNFMKKRLGLKLSTQTDPFFKKFKRKLTLLRISIKERLELFSEAIPIEHPTFINDIQQFVKGIQNEIRCLLSEIFQDCLKCMGSPPPCDFAFLSLGSLAREEITPYSDIEACILISSEDSDSREYFLKVAELFELTIINFGETDLVKGQSLLPPTMLSPTMKGISLDIHKNPAATNGKLIGTVAEFSKYQKPEYYINEPTNHLSSSLRAVGLITASEMGTQLLKQYINNINQILDSTEFDKSQSESEPKNTRRKQLTLTMLEEDLAKFKPNMLSSSDGQLLEIKNDIYRLPQTLLDALALHLKTENFSNWDRIDFFRQLELFQPKTLECLQWLIGLANLWRLKTYSFYEE